MWVQAIVLMTASKKGISAHQLHRTLEVTYKTAWFMAHRIREAMRSGDLAPFGADGGIVEVDETFIGNDRHQAEAHEEGRGYAPQAQGAVAGGPRHRPRPHASSWTTSRRHARADPAREHRQARRAS